MATLIPADARLPLREIEAVNGRRGFQLAEMYELLSCQMVEILPLADGRLMVLDEEGKFSDKPRNERATTLAGFATPKQLVAELLKMRQAGVNVLRIGIGEPLSDKTTETDWIVGDVLICKDDDIR